MGSISLDMKKIVTAVILLCCCGWVKAQGIGGIFDQADTRIKTMLQQIALQQTYLSEIKKGYQTTKDGLNTAHELKDGTFKLHQAYFSSLSAVSPAVMNNPKIRLMISYQQQIMTAFDHEIAWQNQQAILNADEHNYVQAVYSNILSQCTGDLDELKMVTTQGQVQMTDAERIAQIDRLYVATANKYKFSMAFTQNAHAFALNKQNGVQQTQFLQQLYDIK